MIARVKGTEDILDLHLHDAVLKRCSTLLINHHFTAIQTPILEHTNLFVRSLGQETDVISKEMYTFTTKGGDELCLRPEATASTMRAFLEHNIEEKPWRVFSYGSMFRHERPQKGRWREFSQLNMEIVGSSEIAQDAYFIAMLDQLFSADFLLKDYVLKINFLGSSDDRSRYRAQLAGYAQHVADQLCETCKIRKESNILRMLDCKNPVCHQLFENGPKITDFLSSESNTRWQELCSILEMLSISHIHDPFLVRGLDYYNDTVFEFSSGSLGAQNAFCGGGRYDGLAEQLGSSKHVPAIGASIGMGRLILLVEAAQNGFVIPSKPALHVIIPMSEQEQTLALLLAGNLSRAGLCVDVLLDAASMKSHMRKANKMGAAYVLILGEEERISHTVTIKHMITGESANIPQLDVAAYLRR